MNKQEVKTMRPVVWKDEFQHLADLVGILKGDKKVDSGYPFRKMDPFVVENILIELHDILHWMVEVCEAPDFIDKKRQPLKRASNRFAHLFLTGEHVEKLIELEILEKVKNESN